MNRFIRKNKWMLFAFALITGAIVGLVISARMDISKPINAEQKIKEMPCYEAAKGLESAFIAVSDAVGPAVVSISTVHKESVRRYYFGTPESPFGDEFFDRFFKDFFEGMPREFEQRGLGSGVIIDKEGYILTNEHVIRNADKITVTLQDGRKFDGTIKGKDPRSDLAIININAKDLPAAKLGDSDSVKIGQWAIAIGNPFGFAVGSSEPTLTVGVISALNRSIRVGEGRDYTDLIQTDAAINPGNSGGPLVNLEGEIVGINVAIFSTTGGYQGVGFAIPVNRAKDILGDLIEGKKILYGWLGVNIQDITPELAQYFGLTEEEGVLVANVLKDSPAEKGGIKDGDVIRKFDGKKTKDTKQLIKMVTGTKVGSVVELEVIRDKQPKTLKIKIGERPGEISKVEKAAETWRGLQVSGITESIANRFRIEEKEGVIVIDVESDSPAYLAGIRPGDIITKINDFEIKNREDYDKAISKVVGDALVRTQRGFVVIKAE